MLFRSFFLGGFFCCGIVVGRFEIVPGRLKIAVGRCGLLWDRCGSFRVLVTTIIEWKIGSVKELR